MLLTGCNSLINIDVELENATYSSQDGILFNRDGTILIKYPAKKEGVSYNVPDNVTYLSENSFEGCSNLTKIEFPEEIEEKTNFFFGMRTFLGCSSLKQISIPEGVKNIRENMFNGCSSLTDIEIPQSVTNIGTGAFRECSSLEQITIPQSVTKIGSNAFYGCRILKQINIPEKVTYIGGDVFFWM